MTDGASWRHLFVHELRSHLTSGVFLLLAGTSFILALFGANAGVRQFDVASQQHGHYLAQKQGLAGQQLMGWAVEPALRAVRVPSAGSVVIRGLERSRVAFWDFSPYGLIEGPVTEALDQRSESGPLFDYEGVIRILLGLLAISVGVRTVAGQRHDGTLQALLDLPVSRWAIATTELAAALVALACALVPLWLGTAGLVWGLEPALMTTDLHVSGVLVSTMGLAYAGTLVGIGMFIGSLSRSMTTAGGLGIGVWAFLALAYPQLATFTAHAVAPLPSRPVITEERSRMYDGRLANTMEMLGHTAAELGRVGNGAVQLDNSPGARSFIDDLWRDDSAETGYMLKAIEDRARVGEDRHDRLTAWLLAASPSTAFTRAAAALCDTGFAADARWKKSVEGYQALLTEQLFDDPPRLTVLAPSGEAFERVAIFRHPAPTAADLPPFEPPATDLRTRISDAARDIGLLAAYFLLFAVLAVVTFPASGETQRRLGRRIWR